MEITSLIFYILCCQHAYFERYDDNLILEEAQYFFVLRHYVGRRFCEDSGISYQRRIPSYMGAKGHTFTRTANI